MPHRPERSGATNGVGSSSANMTAPYAHALRGETAAHIMRPSTTGGTSVYSNPAGVVTPLMMGKPWLTCAPQAAGSKPMMPTSLATPSKSTDSTDRSTGTRHDEESTVATLATEGTTDEMEKREATANALLLVSTQAIRYDTSKNATIKDKGDSSSESDSGTVPLKKRKRFLRHNDTTEEANKPQPCHISPVSNSSIGSGRTQSANTGQATAATSYDPSKANVSLMNTSKIHNTAEIAPPAHVVVPHFPSLLHQVLSDPSNNHVVEWLPNGEGWKVKRWDALRREILPRYFADLRDENGNGCGTIDAFLWHLMAWGFEEVKGGEDVGAYRHDLFIRGALKLSSKMRFAAVPNDDSQNPSAPKAVSPPRVRSGGTTPSSLQVPSLSSLARPATGESETNAPNKRTRYDQPSSNDVSNSGLGHSTGPLNWPTRPQDSMSIHHRPEDGYAESAAWSHYYPEHGHMMRHVAIGHHYHAAATGYDPRVQLRHLDAATRHPTSHLPAPPQVRSGRGGGRVTKNRTSSPPASNTASARPSFPVSNRGKGRKAGACRTASPLGEAKPAETAAPAPAVTMAEAQRIGSSVQNVAFAISRKTKRKLPLARDAQRTANEVVATTETNK